MVDVGLSEIVWDSEWGEREQDRTDEDGEVKDKEMGKDVILWLGPWECPCVLCIFMVAGGQVENQS